MEEVTLDRESFDHLMALNRKYKWIDRFLFFSMGAFISFFLVVGVEVFASTKLPDTCDKGSVLHYFPFTNPPEFRCVDIIFRDSFEEVCRGCIIKS